MIEDQEIYTMARKRRTSPTLNTAMVRITGMKTIDPALDFGHGLTLAQYEELFQAVQTDLLTYNTMLVSIDALGEQIKIKEAALRAYSERMLMGVTLRYGRGSSEHLRVGGKVRKAKSKRSIAAPPKQTTATSNPIDSLIEVTTNPIEITNGNREMASMN